MLPLTLDYCIYITWMFTQKLRMRTEFKEAECAGLVSLHTRTWRWGDRVLLCLRSNDKLLPLLLGFVWTWSIYARWYILRLHWKDEISRWLSFLDIRDLRRNWIYAHAQVGASRSGSRLACPLLPSSCRPEGQSYLTYCVQCHVQDVIGIDPIVMKNKALG